jgi:hypothetical protein
MTSVVWWSVVKAPGGSVILKHKKHHLLSIKQEKEHLLNGPNDAGCVVWARFDIFQDIERGTLTSRVTALPPYIGSLLALVLPTIKYLIESNNKIEMF